MTCQIPCTQIDLLIYTNCDDTHLNCRLPFLTKFFNLQIVLSACRNNHKQEMVPIRYQTLKELKYYNWIICLTQFSDGSIDVPLWNFLVDTLCKIIPHNKNFWRCTANLNNTNKTNWSSKHDHSTIPQPNMDIFRKHTSLCRLNHQCMHNHVLVLFSLDAFLFLPTQLLPI